MQINLREFNKKAIAKKPVFRRFLSKLRKNPPRGLNTITQNVDQQIWKETDCLSCGNCCKTMSPTYSGADIRRISAHLNMTPAAFRKKMLIRDPDGDWINKTEPCQFLDTVTNYCSIYEVRPQDCAGFPHHNKKHTVQYVHVFKQNIEFCPATYKLVEKMMEIVNEKKI
jgi:Fe-S-cluster containining protein